MIEMYNKYPCVTGDEPGQYIKEDFKENVNDYVLQVPYCEVHISDVRNPKSRLERLSQTIFRVAQTIFRISQTYCL